MGASDEHILSIILYPDSTTWNSADRIKDIWDTYYNTADMIYILHDKDIGEKPHYHYFIRFNGNASRDKFQRDFDISGSCIFNLEEFRNKFQLNPAISKEMIFSWPGCVRYTIHRTESSAYKHQYDFNEITANFDYTKYFKELQSTDPDLKVCWRIIKWAKKGSRNIEDVIQYCNSNGYDQIFAKRFHLIDRVLSRYGWYTEVNYLTYPDDDI